MIKRYKFGKPFPTEAVVKETALQSGELPYLREEQGEKLCFTYLLGKEDEVYGLGENVRGINKRGWLYQSCCVDEPEHLEDRHSLYASHNFFDCKRRENFWRVL